MGFYKNIGATEEAAATKLATQIYRAFHRQELKYIDQPTMGFIMWVGEKWKSYPIKIFKTEQDVIKCCEDTDSTDIKVIDVLNELMKARKSMERSNIIRIKYYLMQGFDIMWWDVWGNEHGTTYI